MKLFAAKRWPGVGETGISSRVLSCERDDIVCKHVILFHLDEERESREKQARTEKEERRRTHIYIRTEKKNLIHRQYKLLIMRPAFTCLLIGPPCLLGKIERSHDRPSLTPNAPRARHDPVFAALSLFLSLSLSLSLFLSLSFPAQCRSLLRVYGHAGSRSTRRWTSMPASSPLTIEIWIRGPRPSLRLILRSSIAEGLVLGLLSGLVVARRELNLTRGTRITSML